MMLMGLARAVHVDAGARRDADGAYCIVQKMG